jgi:hypothetical protein
MFEDDLKILCEYESGLKSPRASVAAMGFSTRRLDDGVVCEGAADTRHRDVPLEEPGRFLGLVCDEPHDPLELAASRVSPGAPALAETVEPKHPAGIDHHLEDERIGHGYADSGPHRGAQHRAARPVSCAKARRSA